MCNEHDIKLDGVVNASNSGSCPVLFSSKSGLCKPRAVFIDTDPNVGSFIRNSPTKDLFDNGKIVYGLESASIVRV